MKERVVLAYSGSAGASVAIPWLAETHGVEVVTVTVDIGQERPLEEIRERALASGAMRAHVVEARDAFARDCILPSLQQDTGCEGAYPAIESLPLPLIARHLVDLAAIESAAAVAHVSNHTAFDQMVSALNPALRVMALAREWRMGTSELADYARARGLPLGAPSDRTCTIDQNLCGRMVTCPADVTPPPDTYRLTTMRAGHPAMAAHVDIQFDRGVPTSINGVPMTLPELIESLALIAGRHGIGRMERLDTARGGGARVLYEAPAAVLLRTALAVRSNDDATVRLRLSGGEFAVLSGRDDRIQQESYA